VTTFTLGDNPFIPSLGAPGPFQEYSAVISCCTHIDVYAY